MKTNVIYSKNTDNWRTPTKIYEAFIEKNYIDCFKYEAKENEMLNNYYDKKLFINPPFSKMKEVTKWVIKQKENGNKIALLIPARTDTKYFHDLIEYNPLIIFIKGRLHYNDSKSAPFPTILLIFNKYASWYQWTKMTQDQLINWIKGNL